MALKFLDANGAGYTSDAIRAINYMTMMRDDGINVVVANCSWGGGAADPALQSAMAAAGKAGILFVVAAGNNGTNNDTTPQYPAKYEASLSNVITVAATDNNDHLASFSSYGVNTVDLGRAGRQHPQHLQRTATATFPAPAWPRRKWPAWPPWPGPWTPTPPSPRSKTPFSKASIPSPVFRARC